MESLVVDIELVRQTSVDDPYEFQLDQRFQPQKYLLREGAARQSELALDWNRQLISDLAQMQDSPTDEDRARLGERLRAFLDARGTWRDREKLLSAPPGRFIDVNFVAGAAELYALPWELLRDQRTGLPLAVSDHLLWRYCWPERAGAPLDTRLAAAGNRLLFAWSDDGGTVPWEPHRDALEQAATDNFIAFHRDQDILADVTPAAMEQALAAAHAANRPYRILHVLCHGAAVDNVYNLSWHQRRAVSPSDLAALLKPYAPELFLVVLCACQSGGYGSPQSLVGTIAQALHRAGIPVVIASRFPLSKAGSTTFCESFYPRLNGAPDALETAFLGARRALQVTQSGADHLALQLWSPPRPSAPVRNRKVWHNLPQLRSGGFVDRENTLAAIEERFAAHARTGMVRPIHLSGLPGVGKTAVASEFAYQRMNHYHTILWLDAQLGDLSSQIAAQAEYLVEDHDPTRTVKENAERVRLALEQDGPHLVILDHAEAPIDQTHLPKTGHADILVTSRLETVPATETLKVDLLSPENALRLLCAGRQLAEQDLAAARTLCDALGRLTLPLKVAAAALDSLRPTELLDWIQQSDAIEAIDDLSDGQPDVTSQQGPALSLLFQKSISLLETPGGPGNVDTIARLMLSVAGFFGPAPIPFDLLASATRRASGEQHKPYLFKRAVGRLAALGLADWAGESVLVHRLIQVYARRQAKSTEQVAVHGAIAESLRTSGRGVQELLALGQLRVHMETVCDAMSEDAPADHLVIPLRLARHLLTAMASRKALEVTERALGRFTQTTTSRRAELMSVKGEALYELGRNREAVDCLREADQLFVAGDPIDRAGQAWNCGVLGKALIDAGDFDEGLAIVQGVYQIADQPMVTFGETITAAALFNPGSQRDLVRRFEETLARTETEFGDAHPAVASMLKGAARLNSAAGLYDRAAVLAGRAVNCSERVYGPEHVNVADALQILGSTNIELGRVDDAVAPLLRARHILDSIPETNPLLRGAVLASLSRAQLRKGEVIDAQRTAEAAASALEPSDLRDSPTWLTVLEALIEVASVVGQSAEATQYERRLQQSLNRLVGDRNPAIARYFEAWQQVRESRTEADLLPRLRAVAQGAEEAFGPDHPATGAALLALGSLLFKTEPAEAEGMLRRTLLIFSAAYGENQPQAAVAAEYLGFSLLAQDKSHDAVPYLERFISFFESSGQGMNELMPQAYMGVGLGRLHEGLPREALEYINEAKSIAEAVYAPDAPIHRHIEANIGFAEANLGLDYSAKEDHIAAVEHLERGVRLISASHGPEDEATVRNMRDLVLELRQSGDTERALEWLPRYLEVLEKTGGRDPDLPMLLRFLGSAAGTQKRLDIAEQANRRLVEVLQADPAADPGETVNGMLRLAVTLIQQEKSDESRDVVEKLLEIRREPPGGDNHDTVFARGLLAGLELARGQRERGRALFEAAQAAYDKADISDPDERASIDELLAEIREDLEKTDVESTG
jgi:tetratricopeptide (TPR) repeat protein